MEQGLGSSHLMTNYTNHAQDCYQQVIPSGSSDSSGGHDHGTQPFGSHVQHDPHQVDGGHASLPVVLGNEQFQQGAQQYEEKLDRQARGWPSGKLIRSF